MSIQNDTNSLMPTGWSYPVGTLRAQLESDLVTPQTRDALLARLDRPPVQWPVYFDPHDFATLRAACDRLIPQPDRLMPIDIAGAIDERLAEGLGDGWRYANMPPDAHAYRLGLLGLDETADALFGGLFHPLDDTRQDAVLQAVQAGTAPGKTWSALPPSLFFEELLADAVEFYYAHPLAQEEIGYVGMLDTHSWQAISLDAHEVREPLPQKVCNL